MQLSWSQDGPIHILEADPLSDPGPDQPFKPEILNRVKGCKGAPWILFDLAMLDYPDRMAVTELLWCNRLVRQHGGALVLLGPSGQLWEHMQAEGATNLIPYRWDRNEALDEFHKVVEEGDAVERLMLGNKLTYRPSLLMKVHRFSAAARMDDPSDDDHPIHHSDELITKPEPEPERPRPETPRPVPPKPAPVAPPPAVAVAPRPAPTAARVAPPPVPAPVRPPDPPARSSEADKADWQLALEVYHTAATLARKHGVPFTQQATFEDFLSAMSDKLN